MPKASLRSVIIMNEMREKNGLHVLLPFEEPPESFASAIAKFRRQTFQDEARKSHT